MQFPQPQTLEGIARILNCDYVGDADFPVLGMNEIHVVRPGDIVFVDDGDDRNIQPDPPSHERNHDTMNRGSSDEPQPQNDEAEHATDLLAGNQARHPWGLKRAHRQV